MATVEIVLGWLLAVAFFGLGVATVWDWWRNREPGRGFLSLAIGLLGLTALIAELNPGPFAGAASLVLFLAAGYALLWFRHKLIPLSRGTRLAATVLLVVAAALAVSQMSSGTPDHPAAPYVVAAVVYLGTWCWFVGEPIVTFWRVSRSLPSVQRMRLRFLSAGYAGILLALVLDVATTLAQVPDWVAVVTEAVAILIVPALAASFNPPAWLRRAWRAAEEEAAMRATRELMLSAPAIEALAAAGLEFAARLVGGEGGFVSGPDGGLIAFRGMSRGAAARAAASIQQSNPGTVGHVHEPHGPTLVAVPLLVGGGTGHLVVVAGPFTPVFGSDELIRLEQYADSLSLALERERLGESVRANAIELDLVNRDLERLVADRTRELQQSSRQTQTILESVADGIITFDADRRIGTFNNAAEEIFGITAEEARDRDALDFVHEASRPDLVKRIATLLTPGGEPDGGNWIETTGLTADGRAFPLELRLSRVDVEAGEIVVGCLRDISERKQYLRELEYQALHDALTGLANRALFQDRLSHALAVAARERTGVTVLLIDLDNFKEVNDSLGHSAGDTLLREAAARLTGKIRASDTLARLGGDEFGLVVNATTERDAVVAARKLGAAIREPFEVDGRRLQVGASIGIARYPAHAADAESLLRSADVAMYAAKRQRSGHAVFQPGQHETGAARITLQADLAQAIREGQLLLHFQPIVALAARELAAVEALVRWQHPEMGLLTPDRFIPIAEDAGLIHDLTTCVIRMALAAVPALARKQPGIQVAVNISALSLANPQLPRQVAAELRRARMEASRLCLEVTETAVMTAPDSRVLDVLRDMGCTLAIDDFGTGHSSLARLRNLPVHELKIDRGFVTGLCQPGGDPAIVRTTVDLAHNLGLRVVAEGVERAEEWAMLRDFGCDEAQGYLIARPMELEQLTEWTVPAGLAGSGLERETGLEPATSTLAR